MNNETILDTTIGDTGPTQNIGAEFLQGNTPIRMHCDLASGDVVKIYGRISESHSWDILHSFTDETPVDIYPSAQIKAERTTDGTAGDSYVYAQNPWPNQILELTKHES